MAYKTLGAASAYRNRIGDYLGVDRGTAIRRLRKMILFDLLVRLGENKCFRCSELIHSIDDLTMDHKEPWLWVDPALFWDLNNVAFAHNKCNTGVPKPRRPQAISLPEEHFYDTEEVTGSIPVSPTMSERKGAVPFSCSINTWRSR